MATAYIIREAFMHRINRDLEMILSQNFSRFGSDGDPRRKKMVRARNIAKSHISLTEEQLYSSEGESKMVELTEKDVSELIDGLKAAPVMIEEDVLPYYKGYGHRFEGMVDQLKKDEGEADRWNQLAVEKGVAPA